MSAWGNHITVKQLKEMLSNLDNDAEVLVAISPNNEIPIYNIDKSLIYQNSYTITLAEELDDYEIY